MEIPNLTQKTQDFVLSAKAKDIVAHAATVGTPLIVMYQDKDGVFYVQQNTSAQAIKDLTTFWVARLAPPPAANIDEKGVFHFMQDVVFDAMSVRQTMKVKFETPLQAN